MLPDCAVSANAVCGNLDRRLQARNAVLRVAPRIVRIYTLGGFESVLCWIGAGIDRYEDELEFPRWTSIHASSSPRRPGCAPRISGSYARHDDLTTNLAWRTRSPSSGSRGRRRGQQPFKRLVGHGPKNRFYRATRELGRVFKTEFILDYLSQPGASHADPTRAPQGRTATRPRPVRPLRPTGPTGSARLRTPNRRGELPASHPRSYHLFADSGDRSCFERGGLGCGRSQLRVTAPYQPDRVGQRPPLRRVPAQPQSRAKRKA